MTTEKTCRECGGPLKSSAHDAQHCSTPCRIAFNRRRRDRGAELYDFVMSGNDGMANILVNEYRKADTVKRNGRPSYQIIEQAMLRMPAVYGDSGDNR